MPETASSPLTSDPATVVRLARSFLAGKPVKKPDWDELEEELAESSKPWDDLTQRLAALWRVPPPKCGVEHLSDFMAWTSSALLPATRIDQAPRH